MLHHYMLQPETNAERFLAFAIRNKVLRFGEFMTKAGRKSPYFFNAGLFSDGASMVSLAGFYSQAIFDSWIDFDMIFGPAYKGIPLATAVAMSMTRQGKNFPFAYNRKEAKDHGEGGVLIGAPIRGRVLVLDDVISAGTSFRESKLIIEEAGGQVAGLAISLDRQERGVGDSSAVQEVLELGVPVVSVATRTDLEHYLRRSERELGNQKVGEALLSILNYAKQYGVS